jgi:hypothetical protein
VREYSRMSPERSISTLRRARVSSSTRPFSSLAYAIRGKMIREAPGEISGKRKGPGSPGPFAFALVDPVAGAGFEPATSGL